MAAVKALGRTGLAEAAEPIIEAFMVGGLKVPLDPITNRWFAATSIILQRFCLTCAARGESRANCWRA
jgi:hypothetical protein